MNKRIYDSDTIKIMVLFETATQSKLKDCFVKDDKIVFVVDEGEIKKAIGKNGFNALNLQKALKRKVRIAEYSSDLIKFINNLVYPINLKEIKNDNSTIIISAIESSDRGVLIGKNASNLRLLEDVVKRFFDINEIKVY